MKYKENAVRRKSRHAWSYLCPWEADGGHEELSENSLSRVALEGSSHLPNKYPERWASSGRRHRLTDMNRSRLDNSPSRHPPVRHPFVISQQPTHIVPPPYRQTHTHARTHARALTHTHAHSLSHTRTHARTQARTHAHTHLLSAHFLHCSVLQFNMFQSLSRLQVILISEIFFMHW
jgi:hypothetical protein